MNDRGRADGGVTRRAVLRLGAAGAGGVLLGAGMGAGMHAGAGVRRPGSGERSVVVIGAGLAGLACALELVGRGCEVTVLEARLVAGGRVRTLREFADGLYVEAGAARIAADHGFSLGYARRFGLELAPFYPPGVEGMPMSGSGLVRIEGGNDRLAREMAGELSERVRYGCAVRRIEHDEGMVRVGFECAGREETASADRLVCTAPLPVLRGIEIDPPLSEEKRDAVERMPYQSLSRVSVQVRRRAWEGRGLTGFGMATGTSEIWHPTWHQPGERGVVQAYLRDGLSVRATRRDGAGRRETALEEIERVIPGVGALAEGCVSVCWDEEPWALGATASMLPGMERTLLPRVAAREGRLHFAGEHTSLWQGWMQGALESGERAAREVMEG